MENDRHRPCWSDLSVRQTTEKRSTAGAEERLCFFFFLIPALGDEVFA